jgi:hypothetical protein
LKRLPLFHNSDSMFVRAGTAPVLFRWDDTRWRQNVVELNASWGKESAHRPVLLCKSGGKITRC